MRQPYMRNIFLFLPQIIRSMRQLLYVLILLISVSFSSNVRSDSTQRNASTISQSTSDKISFNDLPNKELLLTSVCSLSKKPWVCVVLCGLLSLLVYKSGYKLDGLDVLFKKKQLELNKNCQTSVMDFLNGKNVVPQLVEGNEGGTILLEVWYNETAGIAYARLSEYKELSFQDVTGIVELTAENAQSLISRL